MTEEALTNHLRQAKVVYVAEQHTNPSHHQVQLEILHRASELGSVAVGLEMVQHPFQPHLDSYLENGDEDALLKGVEWKQRWGFDFRLYRPIFRWAAEHQHPMVALNAPAELTKAVAQHGPSNVPEELREELPVLDRKNTAHRSRIHLVWQQHASGHGDREFENFYAAQVLWDESMAESIHRFWSDHPKMDRMVVLAGSGHIRYAEGIPTRAERRGVRPGLTIVPLKASDAVDLIGSGIGDILWVFVND